MVVRFPTGARGFFFNMRHSSEVQNEWSYAFTFHIRTWRAQGHR